MRERSGRRQPPAEQSPCIVTKYFIHLVQQAIRRQDVIYDRRTIGRYALPHTISTTTRYGYVRIGAKLQQLQKASRIIVYEQTRTEYICPTCGSPERFMEFDLEQMCRGK